jgi:hypothetical protein
MSSISQIKRHCRRDAGPEVGDDALVAASASQGLLRSAPHVRSTSRARRRFAIISTTFAVERRKLGQDIEASAIEAAGLRFRPVMMTSFAFIFGLLPLVFAGGAGALTRHAVGTPVFGGMIAASVFGIFISPLLYITAERLRGLSGLTAADIAEAHRKDLEVQEKYGVRFLTYWFDESRGTGFCLINAPDIETAMRVHDEAHGDVAKDVIEVDLSAVQAFLGRVSDPAPSAGTNEVTFDSALRAIMFTDIVGSTSMTERLGDARSVEMVRAHDALVRRALKDKDGRVVKHTGDGIMASFEDAAASVQCARAIQQAFEAFNLASKEKLRVRIGIDVGEIGVHDLEVPPLRRFSDAELTSLSTRSCGRRPKSAKARNRGSVGPRAARSLPERWPAVPPWVS